MANENKFDIAVKRLRNGTHKKQRHQSGAVAAARYKSSVEASHTAFGTHVVRDGNHIHCADGIDLFDPEMIRQNEESLVIGDND